MAGKTRRRSICLISSVPITLAFYRDLIKRLRNEGAEVSLVASGLPELYQLGRELHCSIFATEISRKVSPLQDIISVCKLWRYFCKEQPEIVHAHTPKGGMIGMISSYLARIPSRVYTIHGLPLETSRGLERKSLWLAEWLSCRLATSILAVSPSLRQRVIEEGLCAAEKIDILGNGTACGINLSKFKASQSVTLAGRAIRASYSIPQDAIVIGFLGRVVPDKGIDSFVEAFEKLQEVVPKSYLLIVGEFQVVRNKLDDKILNRIKDNPHICYNDEFTAEILPFYGAMDIVTLPSRREGFGLPLIEAGAMELPAIATRVTGCLDAVVDGITGLLVEVDNSHQLYEAMLKLARDGELRKKLGEQGRKRVKALFDSRSLIDKYIGFYNGLWTRACKQRHQVRPKRRQLYLFLKKCCMVMFGGSETTNDVFILKKNGISDIVTPKAEVVTEILQLCTLKRSQMRELKRLQSKATVSYLKLRYGSRNTYVLLAYVDNTLAHVEWIVPADKIRGRYPFVTEDSHSIVSCLTAKGFRGLGIYSSQIQKVITSCVPARTFWIWSACDNIASLKGIRKAGATKVGQFVQKKWLYGIVSCVSFAKDTSAK
jgi:glycosyltransferase involved in cell wall biosynthesis